MASASAQSVLDLIKQPSEYVRQPIGFPGFDAESPRPIALPLQVTILDLWPAVLSSHRDRVTAEIRVCNVGKEPIVIPASKDLTKPIQPGNQDQRLLYIVLRLGPPGGGRPINVTIGSAAGSTSVAGSMITLSPHESLVIRAAGDLSQTSQWQSLSLETTTVAVKVVVSVDFLYPDRFVIRNTSEEAVSTNAKEMVWRYR